MKIIIGVGIIFAAYKLLNITAELSIVSFDVECAVADPEYFKDIEVYIEDEGKDNEFFVNFTIIKSLPTTATQNFKMIGSSMGEYVVASGIDFTVDYCDALNEPIFGKRIYSSLGIHECPPPPGVYGGSHINLVDLDSLPDTFPPNNYKLNVNCLYGKRILFECNVLFKIQ